MDPAEALNMAIAELQTLRKLAANNAKHEAMEDYRMFYIAKQRRLEEAISALKGLMNNDRNESGI